MRSTNFVYVSTGKNFHSTAGEFLEWSAFVCFCCVEVCKRNDFKKTENAKNEWTKSKTAQQLSTILDSIRFFRTKCIQNIDTYKTEYSCSCVIMFLHIVLNFVSMWISLELAAVSIESYSLYIWWLCAFDFLFLYAIKTTIKKNLSLFCT